MSFIEKHLTDLRSNLRVELQSNMKNVKHHYSKADEYAAKVLEGRNKIADIEAVLKGMGIKVPEE